MHFGFTKTAHSCEVCLFVVTLPSLRCSIYIKNFVPFQIAIEAKHNCGLVTILVPFFLVMLLLNAHQNNQFSPRIRLYKENFTYMAFCCYFPFEILRCYGVTH